MDNEPAKQTSDNPRTPEEAPGKQPEGYKKRPLWQWVAIYVIIGAIVYTLIYMLILNNY